MPCLPGLYRKHLYGRRDRYAATVFINQHVVPRCVHEVYRVNFKRSNVIAIHENSGPYEDYALGITGADSFLQNAKAYKAMDRRLPGSSADFRQLFP